ncbi:MAG: hypothetical protein KHY92_16790 [Morganella morganii]|nr:hypothetical protein [Morganella morganii]
MSAVDDARRVAQKLDIPFYVLNFRDSFKRNVIWAVSERLCRAGNAGADAETVPRPSV